MLTALGSFVARWAQGPLWSQAIGIARTLLACAALSTMLFTPMSSVIRPGAGLNPPQCDGLLGASLWCLVPADSYELVRWVVVAVLAVAASGYRPRFTAIPLWWILFSNQASWVSVDGGDQVAAVLALLLVPYSLTDRRRWHWSTAEVTAQEQVGIRAVIARSLILAVQIQMTWVYIDASVSKLAVAEWSDGTALYYWLRDAMFAPPDGPIRALTDIISVAPVTLALMTWGTLVLEAALAVAIVLPKPAKRILLPAGIAFHLGIAVLMGLWSFAFAMWAGLIIALAWDAPWDVRSLLRRTRRTTEVETGAATEKVRPA